MFFVILCSKGYTLFILLRFLLVHCISSLHCRDDPTDFCPSDWSYPDLFPNKYTLDGILWSARAVDLEGTQLRSYPLCFAALSLRYILKGRCHMVPCRRTIGKMLKDLSINPIPCSRRGPARHRISLRHIIFLFATWLFDVEFSFFSPQTRNHHFWTYNRPGITLIWLISPLSGPTFGYKRQIGHIVSKKGCSEWLVTKTFSHDCHFRGFTDSKTLNYFGFWPQKVVFDTSKVGFWRKRDDSESKKWFFGPPDEKIVFQTWNLGFWTLINRSFFFWVTKSFALAIHSQHKSVRMSKKRSVGAPLDLGSIINTSYMRVLHKI